MQDFIFIPTREKVQNTSYLSCPHFRSATWEDRHNLKPHAVGLCMCVQNLASFGMIGNRTSRFSVFLRHVYVAKVWMGSSHSIEGQTDGL